jgi:regulatory protein
MMARAEFKPDPKAKGPAPAQARRGLRKPVKVPTKRRLNNIALFYLKRFSSTAANLRQVLRRRVLKMTRETPELRATAYTDIDVIVESLVASGAVNDALYAAAKVHLDRNLKKTRAKTTAKLRAKGVAKEVIRTAMAENADEDQDFDAGLAIARRRRLGPFRIQPRTRETDHRDLAVLARAGLNFATAKRVLAWTVE